MSRLQGLGLPALRFRAYGLGFGAWGLGRKEEDWSPADQKPGTNSRPTSSKYNATALLKMMLNM